MGHFLSSDMVSCSQSLISFRVVCLIFISCYIFKRFLFTLGFVASRGQGERKLPLAELYCNHSCFINMMFTGLIVHRACHQTGTNIDSIDDNLKGTRKWTVRLMTLFLIPSIFDLIFTLSFCFSLLYKKYRIFCPSYFVIKIKHV